jgi:hypothetical protein
VSRMVQSKYVRTGPVHSDMLSGYTQSVTLESVTKSSLVQPPCCHNKCQQRARNWEMKDGLSPLVPTVSI